MRKFVYTMGLVVGLCILGCFLSASGKSSEVLVDTGSSLSLKIEKLANQLVQFKKKVDHNIWWECGKKYNTPQEIKTAAHEWATAIVKEQSKTTYTLRYSGKEIRPNLREAVGLILNESRFDRCAIGLYTRKHAYKNGLLRRPITHISHSLEEIEDMFPKIEGRLVDLGPGQIVRRVGKNHLPWEQTKKYLTVVPGIKLVFEGMAYRGRIYQTKYPSLHWPGNQKAKWYFLKIMRQTIPMFGPYTPPKKL